MNVMNLNSWDFSWLKRIFEAACGEEHFLVELTPLQFQGVAHFATLLQLTIYRRYYQILYEKHYAIMLYIYGT